jgi:hypothetical protein
MSLEMGYIIILGVLLTLLSLATVIWIEVIEKEINKLRKDLDNIKRTNNKT